MTGAVLKLCVEGPNIEPETYTFSSSRAPHRIYVGRSEDAHVRIGDPLSGRRHASIDLDWARCAVFDNGSANGTFVNGRRLGDERRPLEAGDQIRIGSTIIEVLEAPADEITAERAAVKLDAVEDELLGHIVGRDADSRHVYADWLEGRGKLAHAEFLRLQESLHAAARLDGWHLLAERLRELTGSIDVQWRRKVGRPPIEGCAEAAFELRCPKNWGELAATARSGIRHCGACSRDVYYALSVGEAREHAARGRRVALDAGAVRWKQDLDPPFGGRGCRVCRADLGPAFHEACPACGAEQV